MLIKGMNGKISTIFLILAISAVLSLVLTAVHAAPTGPTVTVLGNSSKNITAGTKVNSTNGSSSPGGFIFTLNLNSLQQNTRWKGYVGNVTGTLTLDDSDDNTLYSWSLSSVTGEVYATRASGSINWTGINCTWIADGINASKHNVSSNRTPETKENQALSHTSPDDNITSTFNGIAHSSITVGSRTIGKDNCYSVTTYQNDAAQSFSDSDNAKFTQVILYDGAFNTSFGNVVYETKIENDVTGYRQDSTYDFQMILPESGATGFTGSTAYYFYVELT